MSYEHIRSSGEYNMVTEWVAAARAANLDKDRYWNIIKNYDAYAAKWGAAKGRVGE